jgi:hypothetical protein
MQRCSLRGSEGDALQAVLCAAGCNLRWLLQAIPARASKSFMCLFRDWPHVGDMARVGSSTCAKLLRHGLNLNFAGPTASGAGEAAACAPLALTRLKPR